MSFYCVALLERGAQEPCGKHITSLLTLLICQSHTLAGFLHGPSFGTPAVYSADSYAALPALTYAAPPPPPPQAAAIFKYATAYAAPQPVIKYSLGAPVTTTTTTYSSFAAPAPAPATFAAAPPPVFAKFAPPTYHAALPPNVYAAPHSYGKFSFHTASPGAFATYAAPAPIPGSIPLPYAAGW
ncbi:extensin-2 [Scaptodrosophila lebanonensis]|uniref:Extensin-2 n=1 Tax=Drosophila lebanonensis TaxID=7225 RepID=A0A6J2UF14_DROLE|nr:extensin-2 [Scaptodrosophila lebanonensis]